jgi:hypothetical protein
MKVSFLALAAAVALATLSPGAADAQTTVPWANPAKVFTTVDAVSINLNCVEVTGIVQGESTPSTWRTYTYSTVTTVDSTGWAAMCQRNALLAMSKPGQYLLEIYFSGSISAPSYCKLTRVNP